MYPTLVDRNPLHKLLHSLSEALDLRLDKVARVDGYTDYLLFGQPDDISFAGRSLREWGFQHIIADVPGRAGTKSIIVKFIWSPK